MDYKSRILVTMNIILVFNRFTMLLDHNKMLLINNRYNIFSKLSNKVFIGNFVLVNTKHNYFKIKRK
jgi:hypothetical protein